MRKDIFDYDDYKKYLHDLFLSQPSQGHGFRSRLAEAAGCRVSYVSQVLNQDADFSLEQAENLNPLLGHNAEESDFFLLLIQYARAGSHALKTRLKEQILRFRQKRLVLKDRVDIKTTLSPVDQMTYYSAWYYAAIHILVMMPEYRTREAISKYLRMPSEKVSEALKFLTSVGLVKSDGSKYLPGVSRIFLGNDSPMISKHHTNWRMRAIDSLDRDLKNDLHLSTVLSLSREDVIHLKELLAKSIDKGRDIAAKSLKDEEVHCLCVDLFKI
ncbi:MAG: TIGR02147 family protein [Bdellovibrionia bacterium]